MIRRDELLKMWDAGFRFVGFHAQDVMKIAQDMGMTLGEFDAQQILEKMITEHDVNTGIDGELIQMHIKIYVNQHYGSNSDNSDDN